MEGRRQCRWLRVRGVRHSAVLCFVALAMARLPKWPELQLFSAGVSTPLAWAGQSRPRLTKPFCLAQKFSMLSSSLRLRPLEEVV